MAHAKVSLELARELLQIPLSQGHCRQAMEEVSPRYVGCGWWKRASYPHLQI